jgi:hypothetical protein
VNNNPVRYNDPTGHIQTCADGDFGGGCGSESTAATYMGAMNSWFENVSIVNPKSWSIKQLITLIKGLFTASAIHGGTDEFKKDVGKFTVLRTRNPSISGMTIPVSSNSFMILNSSYLTANNRDSLETILQETAHVFDFNGKVNKSGDFISTFSNSSSCKNLLLGCLNEQTRNYQRAMQFYGGINITIYGTPNLGYQPSRQETTLYGAISSIEDWAESYMVIGLENAGEQLTTDQMNISPERKAIIEGWLNK